MTGPNACPRDHSRLPYRFVLGVKVTCGTCSAEVRVPGWRCGSCGWALLDSASPSWRRHGSTSEHRLAAERRELKESPPSSPAAAMPAYLETPEDVGQTPPPAFSAQAATEKAALPAARAEGIPDIDSLIADLDKIGGEILRRAPKKDGNSSEEPAAEERVAAEAERRAAEVEARRAEAAERERKEKELVERVEAERRRTEIDTALVAGKDPDLIPSSVRGASVAQVRARQVELARLKENRGKPWAELALDREVLRLVQAGVDRPTIVKQLGVGAHRVARVRRDAGLKSRRFKRAASEPGPEQISRSLPDPDVRSESLPSEEDRPRRPAPE